MSGMSRWKLIAGLVAPALVVAFTPQAAFAAAVTVSAKVISSIEIAFGSCTEHIFVYTQANFSPLARYDEVRVSFSGPAAPLGRADSHTHSGGVTSDDFTFQFPVAGLVPGATLTVEAKWQAHNGNGLSTGYDTATTSVTLPSASYAHKASLASKCKIEQQSKDAATRAAGERANAASARARGDAIGGKVWDELAAANDVIARNLHKLALDPPDPNFTTLPTPATITPPTVPAGSGISAEAAIAVNDLQRLLADCASLAGAALSAIEKSQGARQAADSEWEKKQALAAADFFKALATKIAGLPAAMQTAGSRLQAGGFANPSITPADRSSAVRNYLDSGPSNADWLRQQAGFSAADFALVAGLLGTSAKTITGPQPALAHLTDPGVAQRVGEFVAALNAEAAALIANPLVDHGTETGTPASPSPTAVPSRSPNAAEGASLLRNSGFEDPALPKGWAYQTVTAGKAPGLGAWTIQRGSVDVVAAPGATAATGGQFIDLNGNDTKDAGIITQEVSGTAGHKYRLSFQLAGNPNGDPPLKTLDVSLGDKKQSFSFDTKGHTNTDPRLGHPHDGRVRQLEVHGEVRVDDQGDPRAQHRQRDADRSRFRLRARDCLVAHHSRHRAGSGARRDGGLLLAPQAFGYAGRTCDMIR